MPLPPIRSSDKENIITVQILSARVGSGGLVYFDIIENATARYIVTVCPEQKRENQGFIIGSKIGMKYTVLDVCFFFFRFQTNDPSKIYSRVSAMCNNYNVSFASPKRTENN